MKHVLLVLAWMFIISQANSQFYSFSGKISDQNGHPLTGANVWFENTFMGTVSDLNGEFEFKKIAAGNYTLKISYVGYETFSEPIIINSNWYNVYSLKEARVMGEEAFIMAVRAGQKDPVAFTNISGDEIAKKNTGRDIPFLLSMTPSLVYSTDAGHGIGYSGFRIRGTDANRINITMNGIPLNDSESHGVWWVNMPDMASSIQNMQIQRGVGTSSNGAAAFGASVNIETLSLKEEPYAEIGSSYGSFNSRKNTLQAGTGLINDKLSMDVRLSSIHSDGYIDRASSDLTSYYLSARWQGTKSRLKLITFSGNEKTYQAWDGVPSYMLDSARTFNGLGMYTDANGNTQFYDNQTDNYKQEHYQMHYTRDIRQYLSLNTSLHLTRGAGYYEQYRENAKLSAYRLPPVDIGTETISRSDLIRRKWLDNDFYGAVFSIIWRPGNFEGVMGGGWNIYDGDHFGDIIWARYAGKTELNHKWYENTGVKQDFNVYSKGTFPVSARFRIYSDLQLRKINYQIDGIDDDLRDISQKHDFLFFNPKLGWNYDIEQNKRLFFSFSVANREPNRGNFTDAKQGSPPPSFETLYDYEAGFSMNSGSWAGDINYYFMDYHNQLVLTGEINDVGNPVMTNVKSSYRTGLELVSRTKFGDRLRWNANLTLSRNKIRNMVLLVDNWDYWADPENEPFQISSEPGKTTLGFSPSVIGSSIINFKLHKFLSLEIQSKYVGKQYIDNSASDMRKLDPYFINDLYLFSGFSTPYFSEINISFTLANIFNHKYSSNAWIYRFYEGGEEKFMDGYFPQAGLHFMAGLSLRF
jgi:iron complex outermembrane recepter protein